MVEVELLDNITKSGKDVIRDIEIAFLGFSLVADDTTKNIIKLVEDSKYDGGTVFVDKCGVTLYTSELSTGCKACLCAYYNPDKYISFEEAGVNALGAALSLLKNAKICLYRLDDNIYDYGVENSFMICPYNRIFSSIKEYNEWEG